MIDILVFTSTPPKNLVKDFRSVHSSWVLLVCYIRIIRMSIVDTYQYFNFFCHFNRPCLPDEKMVNMIDLCTGCGCHYIFVSKAKWIEWHCRFWYRTLWPCCFWRNWMSLNLSQHYTWGGGIVVRKVRGLEDKGRCFVMCHCVCTTCEAERLRVLTENDTLRGKTEDVESGAGCFYARANNGDVLLLQPATSAFYISTSM